MRSSPLARSPLALVALAALSLGLSACCIPLGPTDDQVGDSRSASPAVSERAEQLPPLPAAPTTLGDSTASAAARPTWASGTDYAPQASREVAELTQPASGPLREGLLACTLSSHHVENHIRKRNNVPDLDVQLAWQGRTLFVRGADNTASVFITAPLVSLDPGDDLSVLVWDRGLIFRKKLGALAARYDAFPLSQESGGLRLDCGWVPRDSLEPLVQRHLEDAGRRLLAWRVQADLTAEQIAPEAQGSAAREAIEHAAGLVGWADPRVQARADQYAERRVEHLAALRGAIEAERARLPAGWTELDSVAWAPGTVQADELALRVSVPVKPTAGPVEQFAGLLPDLSEVQLIDAEGHQATLLYEGIGAEGDDVRGPLRVEDRAAFMAMVQEPAHWRPPFLLRARVGGRWVFQKLEARGG